MQLIAPLSRQRCGTEHDQRYLLRSGQIRRFRQVRSITGCLRVSPCRVRRRPELEDFFLYLINYFYWYFEHLDAQVQSNPLCV